LAPEWKKAAASLKNMVKFGAVDCTVETSLAQRYDIKGYPTIKVFGPGVVGKAKDKSTDYQGPRTSQGLSTFALNLIPSNLVYTLSDENPEEALKNWFQSTAGSNMGVSVLLFTNKPTAPPLIKSLSVEYEGLVSFAIAKDSDVLLARQFNVTTFPSLFLIRSAKEIIPYPGQLSWTALTQTLDALTNNKRSEMPSGASSSSSSSSSSTPPSTSQEVLVHIPKTSEEFSNECLNKGGLCVLTFLSEEAQQESEKYIQILETVSSKERDRSRTTPSPYHFLVLSRSTQFAMADNWNIPVGPATTCVLAAKKKRMALYVGVFESEGLLDFLAKVKTGKQNTFGIPTVPDFVNEANNKSNSDETNETNDDNDNENDNEKNKNQKTKDEL